VNDKEVGMTAVRRDQPMTVAEFLEWDDGRYELVEGVPRLMSPHTDKHATMQSNIAGEVRSHLRATRIPCRVATEGGVKPRIRSTYNHRKPDITVTCTPNRAGDVFIPDPILIIEILSTNEDETRDNIARFTSLESVREIVLFHQDDPLAEVWRRIDGVWPEDPELIVGEVIRGEPQTVAGSVRLEAIDMTLDFAEVYLWCDMTGEAREQ
jgi:Uma2 family endonuclease